MKTLHTPPQGSLYTRAIIAIALTLLSILPGITRAADAISDSAKVQIEALIAEKQGRTAAQKKMDSQLVYLAKQSRNEIIAAAAPNLVIDLKADADNRVLVDISATVSDELLEAITQGGGTIVNHFAAFDAIRAKVPIGMVETLAARGDVRSIGPAALAITNVGSALSQGDRTHRADTARALTGATGSGVKIGVLSDGVNSLAASKANGNLNASATFLAGQAGSGDEGTAMMELIQDLVPDAQIIFATAFNGDTSMAANIVALQAAGCTIIVDDVLYFNESPFQDGVISQAVNTVSAAGAMYFSCARNSGNKNDGTSGTWEGDFVSGGAVAAPVTGTGNLLDFGGGVTFNTVTAGGSSRRVDLFWADPAGASANDYDFFVLDATGASVLRSSTNVQTGTQNPYESTSTLNAGERIVIVQRTGAANRFLHLDTGRAVLTISTDGSVRGHNASGAANAFSVAATNVANSPSPNFFVGGVTNPVETYSSDGPRRMFFSPAGVAITPGNFSSTGGTVLSKPDITAADGITTSVPGFTSFFGTSASAPHAAAIAALIKSYNSTLTPAQIRTAMMSTALDIEAPGFDRDSGAGIVMALGAIQAVAAPDVVISGTPLFIATGPVGGPFNPASATYTITNSSAASLNWTATKTQAWTTLSPASGTLAPGASVTVTCSFNATANGLGGGNFTDVVTITDTTTGTSRGFNVSLTTVAPTTPFSNATAITIPAGAPATTLGPASLYPSNIVVSGLTGTVTRVTVNLRGLSHTWPADVDMLLVSPSGQKFVLLSDVIGSSGWTNIDYTLDDTAGSLVPSAATPVSGTFLPTNYGTGDTFTAPAPASPYQDAASAGSATFASVFNGINPNGTWSLYIMDDAAGDVGTMAGGWTINIATTSTSTAPTVTANTANIASNATTLTIAGTGFSTTQGNNTVAFTPSGTGTVTAANATSLTVTGITGLSPGVLNAVVTVSGSGNSGAPVQVATVITSPAVTSILPASGSEAGGTPVTITGTAFTGATAVTVGGVPVTGVSVVNDTTITGTTAAHAIGTSNVVVTTTVGSGTGTNLYTYAAVNVLYNNGPFVTHPKGGAGGTDESQLQSSLSMSAFGFTGNTASFRLSDGFTVPAGQTWTLNEVIVFAYQTGSTTTSSFTGLTLRIWDGPPNVVGSNVVFGDTSTNRLASSTFYGVYRTIETAAGDTQRPLMRLKATVGGLNLNAGTYWLDWTASGSIASGPFFPPITILGQSTTGDALQSTTAAGTAWNAVTDGGSLTAQGMPFLLVGPAQSAPIVTTNPSNQTVTEGATASFNAAASGSPVPTVQWEVSTDGGANFNPIGGATSIPLSFIVAFSQNGYQYRAVFTNGVGSPATTTAATLTVNRKPIPGVVSVERYPSQGVKVPVAQILGAATDPDGDTISLFSTANGANGTTQVIGTFVLYQPAANFQGADSFTYVLQDSRGAQATGTVTITIKVDNDETKNITKLTRLPDGTAVVNFAAIPGYTYGLQYTDILGNPWQNLGPVTADSVGSATYTDTDPVHKASPTGFYRFIYPAPNPNP
jgi:subtilisin-like proprotein convertase family protein